MITEQARLHECNRLFSNGLNFPKFHFKIIGGWIMHSTDSNYSPVNKIEQPIDLIDIDTHKLEKQQTHGFPLLL